MSKEHETDKYQQDQLLKSIINLFVYNNCDYFIYLDVKRNSYTMFSGSESGTPLPPAECSDYSTELVNYANSFVVPEDRDNVIREMSLERVVEQLELYGKHVIYCGIEDPVRGYTRKQLEYRYYDRENQMVLLSRTDLTDVYLEQKRQQEALKEALRIAEEANTAKSLFFSNMSHDIRTPMNAIVGFATLLEKDTANEEKVKAYTEKILNSSKLLLSLLNDVLDISQIESGKTSLNISEMNMTELINELDIMIRPQIEERRQAFHVQIKDLPHENLRGDKIRTTQILMNILNNAMKYTPEGGKINFIIENAFQKDDDFVTVRFAVEDNGIGISPEFIKNLYEPFAREQNKMINQIQGTGLGLALTKTLVDLLNGTIAVCSEPGKGSTFTVELPFQISNDETSLARKWEEEELENKPLQGLHILAAEDNELNAEILSELLRIAGAECEIVSNGQAAVHRFQELLPEGCDLILMDIQMPVMDGYEAARSIRLIDNEKAKTIPIIAMTANAFTEDVQKAFASGMNAHLAKPVVVDKLYRTITTLK